VQECRVHESPHSRPGCWSPTPPRNPGQQALLALAHLRNGDPFSRLAAGFGVADQKPYYSGKHKQHGVNLQVIADPAVRLVWASPALPSAVHDLTAARTHDIVNTLTSEQVMTFADRRYQRAGGSIRTPFKRHRRRQRLSRREKAVNRVHARIRALGERAIATLKTWRLLSKLRCRPRRATAIVQAILALHHIENPTYGS
jgi:hypothetical protein